MHERKINLPDIVRSNGKSVVLMRNDNYESLFDFVIRCVTMYLNYCFPNQVNIAPQFAADLIDTRPNWKAEDFINVFKFFRTSTHEGLKVFGNTITPQRLMEMVSVYEEHRANEFELYKKELKSKPLETPQEVAAIFLNAGNKEWKQGDERLGKLMDAQRAKSEREGYGRSATPKQRHNDFFEPKK